MRIAILTLACAAIGCTCSRTHETFCAEPQTSQKEPKLKAMPHHPINWASQAISLMWSYSSSEGGEPLFRFVWLPPGRHPLVMEVDLIPSSRDKGILNAWEFAGSGEQPGRVIRMSTKVLSSVYVRHLFELSYRSEWCTKHVDEEVIPEDSAAWVVEVPCDGHHARFSSIGRMREREIFFWLAYWSGLDPVFDVEKKGYAFGWPFSNDDYEEISRKSCEPSIKPPSRR